MPIQVRPAGPIPARVMIVGEAPGAEEERQGEPFVGASGYELTKMLHEAGISRSECFITNVCRIRPPANDITNFIAKSKKDRTHEHFQLRDKWVKRPIIEGADLLQREIEFVKPQIIITLGNVPLWTLTGKWGIVRWRGSMLSVGPIRLLPTYHPAAVLRQWDWRAIVVHDLKRAAKYRSLDWPSPKWNFLVRPSFRAACDTLDGLIGWAADGPLEVTVLDYRYTPNGILYKLEPLVQPKPSLHTETTKLGRKNQVVTNGPLTWMVLATHVQRISGTTRMMRVNLMTGEEQAADTDVTD